MEGVLASGMFIGTPQKAFIVDIDIDGRLDAVLSSNNAELVVMKNATTQTTGAVSFTTVTIFLSIK